MDLLSSKELRDDFDKKKPWYKHITTEPSMFFYMMAFMTTSVIESTFYIFRACTVNHRYSEEICYNISAYPEINTEVQATISIFHQWFGITSQLVPCILAFFLGAYSDRRGRKGVLLAGLIGKLYFSVAIIVNTLFEWPVEYVLWTAAFPSALTGADVAIFAATFAYVADVTTADNRTLRIGILDIVYMSTLPTGVALGNFLYNKVVNRSFTIMFIINVCLMTVATVYTLLMLNWQSRPEQKSMKEAGVRNPLADFFDIKHVKKTFVTLSKKRSNHQRTYLWMLLIAMGFYTFQKDERPMMYLYTIATFGWGLTEFSNFRTYLSSIYVIVMLIGIPLMTKVLKVKDTVIVMLGAASHMAGRLVFSQASAGGGMYAGATAAALGPCISALIRSMASKVLAPDEKGVAYAFLSVMQIAVGMFAAVIYSQIYNAALRNGGPLNAIFYFTIATQAVVFTIALTMEIMLRGRRLEVAVGNQEDKTILDATDNKTKNQQM